MHLQVYLPMKFFIKSNFLKLWIIWHAFQRHFTYIILFESHSIFWARQSGNHDLHVIDELRLRELVWSSTAMWLVMAKPGPQCPSWMSSWFILYMFMYWSCHLAFQVSIPFLFPSPMKKTISTTKTILLLLHPLPQIPHNQRKWTSSSTLFQSHVFLMLTHFLWVRR